MTEIMFSLYSYDKNIFGVLVFCILAFSFQRWDPARRIRAFEKIQNYISCIFYLNLKIAKNINNSIPGNDKALKEEENEILF